VSAPLGLVILAVAIVGFFIVNSIEIAVVGANRIRVHHLAEQGSKAGQALQALQNDQERFFAAIVLLQNIFGGVAASMGSLIAIDLAGYGAVAVAVPLVSVILAEFGELLPKVLAAHSSDRFALFAAIPAQALTRIMSPFVAAMGFLPSVL
jgi:putative hemolysin